MQYRRIKEMREDRDYTQKYVAAQLHIARSTYSGYENGTRSIPPEILCLLADLYACSVDALLGREKPNV